MFYIYGLRVGGNDEYRYVGSTSRPQRRLWGHKCAPEGNPNKYEWIQENRDSVIMDILECVTAGNPREREQEWITNLTNAGHSLLNMRRSDLNTPFSRLSEIEKVMVIDGYLNDIEGDSDTPWLND